MFQLRTLMRGDTQNAHDKYTPHRPMAKNNRNQQKKRTKPAVGDLYLLYDRRVEAYSAPVFIVRLMRHGEVLR